MTVLTLTLIAQPDEPVDMSPLTPDRLSGLSTREVGAVRLRCGNRAVTVDDLFSVAGHGTGHLRIVGSTARLECVGAGLAAGLVEVRGTVGPRAGLKMSGGQLWVDGHAGDWAGSGMSGGTLTITGDASGFVGSALPGESHGMTDGLISIRGNAGDRVGDRQRRGLVVIGGDAGDYCGNRMLAGTVIVLGTAGRLVGAGMRRGTIVLRRPPRLIGATFNSCGPLTMEVLRLLFRELPRTHRLTDLSRLPPLAERWAGDLAVGGKGEILVLQSRLP